MGRNIQCLHWTSSRIQVKYLPLITFLSCMASLIIWSTITKRMYVAFIDYTQYFDYVVRDILWYKLRVGGNILNIIKSLYQSISRLKSKDNISEEFTYNLGVRQVFFKLKSYLIKFPDMNLTFLIKLVLPVLSFGSEIWPYTNGDVLEKNCLRCCKQWLGISLQSQNRFVHGELGTRPIKNKLIVNMIRYWIQYI